ncbi:cytochrome P450 [Panus rudis PR-1116 ss-1]|nr:cytochrome P450 [Panus rudis PR-1116 ss-1]
MTTPIPSPPSVPFLGHMTALDREIPHLSFLLLADQYGEIYQLNILTRKAVVVNSYELVNEVSDETRFEKTIPQTLLETRSALGDGLFTAYKDEPNWGIAHRMLMPAFGNIAIRDMFDDMMDIAQQLVLKWERFGPAHVIDPAEDFTRLTFDTIALTAMTYRLNSFYRDTNHPFIQAMGDFLIEANARANRPTLVTAVMRGTNAKYEQDIKTMADLADQIIADRRKTPIDKPDLLNKMLYEKDSKTGQGLSDENIRFNLLTFLLAGHETTSGTLTFALYHLIKNPESMRKLQEEVDEVLGDQTLQLSDLGRLKYTMAVIREALRLNSPAAQRVVKPKEDTTIGGGKYFIPKGVNIVINTWKHHRDPEVWGEDAELFRPERMLDGKFEALPPNAWQPFGYGSRACIGRALALQEAQICLACIVQKFNFEMKDASYELRLKQTMTLKPGGFYVHAIPRPEKANILKVPSKPGQVKESKQKYAPGVQVSETGHPLHVLYGSNAGSSEAFAQRIASEAAAYGFRASFQTLDSATNNIPTDGPVVIVTASFEGEPADNAARFFDWLVNLKRQELANVQYAVFGCGNRDWSRTYQRIPRLIDEHMGERGAERILPRGEADASSADFFTSFDEWVEKLWEVLPNKYKTTVSKDTSTPALTVKEVGSTTQRAEALRQPDIQVGTVLENTVLTAPGTPEKRHLVIQLPDGMSYRAGDYLAILPTNPARTVERTIARLGLSQEQQVSLSSPGPTSLPVDQAVTVYNLLSGYVELQQPATLRDLQQLSELESSPETKQALNDLSTNYSDKVQAKRLSVLDILEEHPDIKIDLGKLLTLLPSMRIRQYSISSSPLWNASQATLTVSIVDAPSLSGRSEPFLGVASTYLASLRPGSKLQVSVRSSSQAFHPPQDPSVPLVLFCAGTGLAPLRGFIQDRAYQKKAGRQVGKALLFFGCRKPTDDYLYSQSDLKEWTELGVVDVRPAFSRASDESQGCKYVQDRAWHDREDINNAFDAGARFFTCGSRKIAEGVRTVLTAIIKDRHGTDDATAEKLFERASLSRYATDIFD